MSTDPAKLPQYKGRPVPWVTRWTGEIIYQPFTVEATRNSFRLTYADDILEDRLDGVLWQREGVARGGEPQWKSVSTYRQRLAMRKNHCQVCGDRITEKPLRFLIPLDGIEWLDEDTPLTMQAPTCSDCIPLALSLCPHMKRFGYQILKVASTEPWGVYGEVIFVNEAGEPRRMMTFIGYDMHEPPTFSLGQVMAKQQVVKLGKFIVEETHKPSP